MGMARVIEAKPSPSTHPLEDHPKYVKAIGMVALETVAVEVYMARLLARTLSIPLRTARAIYLSPKSEQTRLDVFLNATHAALHVSPSKANSQLGRQKKNALSKTNKLHARAMNLIRKRHRIIHDEWNYSDTERIVTRRVTDGRHGRERAKAAMVELTDLIHDLRVLVDDIEALAADFLKNPPTMASLS